MEWENPRPQGSIPHRAGIRLRRRSGRSSSSSRRSIRTASATGRLAHRPPARHRPRDASAVGPPSRDRPRDASGDHERGARARHRAIASTSSSYCSRRESCSSSSPGIRWPPLRSPLQRSDPSAQAGGAGAALPPEPREPCRCRRAPGEPARISSDGCRPSSLRLRPRSD